MEKQQQDAPQQHNVEPQLEAEVQKSGMIRWQGLLGFTTIMITIALLLWVFAGRIIKVGIEQGGSWYWGAQVDVANVDVNWSPFKLSVQGLEATDPHQPSHNLFEFTQANASVDLWQGLLGRAIIHELVVTDVALNQQRDAVGRVTSLSISKADGEDGSVLDASVQALPNVEDILARSDLKTVQAGLKLKQLYQSEQVVLDDIRKDLPTTAELKEYELAVKRLSDTKVETPEQAKQLKDEFDKLKQKFKADKKVLKKAKEQLSSSGTKIAEAMVELKDAPAQDMKMINEKYQFNGTGAQNFTELLFGPQAKEYVRLAEEYYHKFKPLLDKIGQGKAAEAELEPAQGGRFIHFTEEHPMPDWLVEKAQISMKLEQGMFDIEINELTAQHWMRQTATTLKVKSENLLNTGILALNGELFVESQGEVKADANWKVKGLSLQDTAVSDSEALKVSLNKATIELDGTLNFAKQQFVNANHIMLNDTAFVGSADGKMGKILVDILAEVQQLSMDVGTNGNAKEQQMTFKSDLDNTMMAAVKQRFKGEMANFKAKAQAGLKDKLAEQLKLSQGDASAMEALAGDFDNIEQQLEALLKSQVGDKLKDGLKDKLMKKLGDFF